MLATTPNEYNWETSNTGSTITETGIGTSILASASANTKGTTTALLTAIAEDCYWLDLWFTNGATSGASAFEAKMFSGF